MGARRSGAVWFVAFLAFAVTSAGPTAGTGTAGLLDSLQNVLSPESGSGSGQPSTSEVSSGLLEALRLGAEKAVGKASAVGGFLDNPRIRVPLPKTVQKVAGTLRALGLGQEVDDFETALNRGAERASKEALPIFLDAIKGLTFQDVERIWKGGSTAATDYLKDKTSGALQTAFRPAVHGACQEVGVTRAYASLTDNALTKSALSGSDFDLDTYVTGKALDGLFTLVADEERAIRSNPAARTTELLKKIFGS